MKDNKYTNKDFGLSYGKDGILKFRSQSEKERTDLEELRKKVLDDIKGNIRFVTTYNGDGEWLYEGSFHSQQYNSVWISVITTSMEDDAIQNSEDPSDIQWIIAQGNECNDVDGDYFSGQAFGEDDGVMMFNCHLYAFLYDNENDEVSETIYYDVELSAEYENQGGGGEPSGDEDDE